MPDVKHRTKLSFAGRAITGSVAAALLIVAFALAPFTRDKVEASKLPAAQGNGEIATGQTGQSGATIEPMSKDLKPTILYKEKAQYTEEALRNRLEGVVILAVVFAADGKITNIQVFSGLPDGLTESSIEAVKMIRFEPATRDGKPVSVRGKLEFDFKLESAGVDPTAKRDGAAASEKIEAMSASLRPTLTYKEQADYTPEARDNKVEGVVMLNIIFGADGRISAIRVVRGLPYGLTEAAIAAARRIRFEPAMKDGKPVSVRGNLEFGFSL
jgi:TonB family protein